MLSEKRIKGTIVFDLYETLITNFDHDFIAPSESVAMRLGVTDADFKLLWKQTKRQRMTGEIPTYAAALAVLEHICGELNAPVDLALIKQLSDERVQF